MIFKIKNKTNMIQKFHSCAKKKNNLLKNILKSGMIVQCVGHLPCTTFDPDSILSIPYGTLRPSPGMITEHRVK